MEKIQVQPTAIVLIILAFPYRFSHATLKAISHVACSFAVFAVSSHMTPQGSGANLISDFWPLSWPP